MLFCIWQRLSSSGYVFSASLPPYLASAAITAIDVLEENPEHITKLKKNIATVYKGSTLYSSIYLKCHTRLSFLLHIYVLFHPSHYLILKYFQVYQVYKALN